MEKQSSNAIVILGLLLALGMTSAAFVLGIQAKKVAAGQQAITVKGLATKEIQADSAEWTVTVGVTKPTFGEALTALRGELPALEAFLTAKGLDSKTWQEGREQVSAHMVTIDLADGRTKTEQQGFDAVQNIVIKTKDLSKIVAASKDFLALQAEGRPYASEAPKYLVSNLEEIKMSLIAAATDNAHKRAEEFVRQDKVKVGLMRSASQGAFYILPAGGESDTDDYGGTYDKTTIDKIAKVVVTIVYGMEQ